MDAERNVPLAQRLRYDGSYWRRLAYMGSVYGPQWWRRYSPPWFGALFFLLIGKNRRAAVANFRRVLDTGTIGAHAAAWRMFRQFACCFSETLEYYGPHPAPVEIERPPRDLLAQALARGRGAVIVTAHIGNWDIAAKALTTYGIPVHLVMAREANATTREYLRPAREAAGIQVIYSDESVYSSFKMIHALRRNEIVALQLDRVAAPTSGRWIPFFGQPTLFPAGPFVLARLAGAPICPVFVTRLGYRRYAIRESGLFVVPRGGKKSLDESMSRVVAELEKIIRELPTQWFQFTGIAHDPSRSVARVAPEHPRARRASL